MKNVQAHTHTHRYTYIHAHTHAVMFFAVINRVMIEGTYLVENAWVGGAAARGRVHTDRTVSSEHVATYTWTRRPVSLLIRSS